MCRKQRKKKETPTFNNVGFNVNVQGHLLSHVSSMQVYGFASYFLKELLTHKWRNVCVCETGVPIKVSHLKEGTSKDTPLEIFNYLNEVGYVSSTLEHWYICRMLYMLLFEVYACFVLFFFPQRKARSRPNRHRGKPLRRNEVQRYSLHPRDLPVLCCFWQLYIP